MSSCDSFHTGGGTLSPPLVCLRDAFASSISNTFAALGPRHSATAGRSEASQTTRARDDALERRMVWKGAGKEPGEVMGMRRVGEESVVAARVKTVSTA